MSLKLNSRNVSYRLGHVKVVRGESHVNYIPGTLVIG